MVTKSPTINNRRARHDYAISDVYECGMVLEGSEVKSIRSGHVELGEGYARVEDGEVWLHNVHINPYEFSRGEVDPLRKRKLLLHTKEIGELFRATQENGVTLVPLKIYFKEGRAKLELGIGKGKHQYDKRQALRKKTDEREAEREMKARRR